MLSIIGGHFSVKATSMASAFYSFVPLLLTILWIPEGSVSIVLNCPFYERLLDSK